MCPLGGSVVLITQLKPRGCNYARKRVKMSYILIAHVPVWSFSIGHDLPHDDAITPHIAGRGKLSVLDRLRRGPSDGNLPSLQIK